MTKEQQIEEALIAKLEDLKYTYRKDIRDKEALEKNFRQKFEALNRVNLTDAEFARLHDEIVNDNVFTAATTLRERNVFQREDGTPLHYTLVNTKDWCKNEFEVINQLRMNTDNSFHRYDVILLINGIPVVQIELKSLDVSPRRAMEQIVDYKNDPGNGYTKTLLCFMQLFIVSNENNTRYFANNQNSHFSFDADEQFLPVYELATEDNKKIHHLHDFTKHFLAKCTLGQMISRYMVLVASEQKLMIMRPYQIYAVKAIDDCIQQNRGNGYIWHTTGSGKTLTSFKASTLLKDNDDIAKCLFVVDRKDLDRQTREEFNKFQEGCVEENTNTETLVQRMLSEDYADKVIVTTIQKLGLALDETNKRSIANKQNGKKTYKERLAPLRDQRIVFIFDECHRSQFGDNHQAIKSFFPNAQLFGFTGTPIFEKNATVKKIDGTIETFKTTKDIFQKELHAYTITHAIEDGNVLRFAIDYFGEKPKEEKKSKAKPKAPAPEAVVKEILNKHPAASDHRRFNALLATSSINHAIEYFELFKEVQTQKRLKNDNYQPLNIACVFSPPTQVLAKGKDSKNAKNIADIKQLQDELHQEKEDNKQEPEKKKAALMAIIADYNQQYGAEHKINEFDLYYQDVQQRIKDQKYNNKDYAQKNKIDIVIVVDMLLTGFDSKYLSTLYVDKNLKNHGLIQAFSRTNRVLNGTKPHGKILDFRYQEEAVDEAIALFSGANTAQAKEIWLVDPAPKVIKQLDKAVSQLEEFMKSQGLASTPEEVNNLKGDAARGEFINHFKKVQSLKTRLDQYTDLSETQTEKITARLPEDQLRGFRSMYLETAQRLKAQQGKGADTNDATQQLDFELVLFSSSIIDYDYIMGLIANATSDTASKQNMTRQQVIDLICSHSNMIEERDNIVDYINSLPTGKNQNIAALREGYNTFKAEKSAKELATIAKKHGLTSQSLKRFVDAIMDRMIFDGEQLSDLLEPLDLGWKARTKAELALMEDLVPLLKKLAEGRDISGLSAYE